MKFKNFCADKKSKQSNSSWDERKYLPYIWQISYYNMNNFLFPYCPAIM